LAVKFIRWLAGYMKTFCLGDARSTRWH